jgi:hypothetical protein
MASLDRQLLDPIGSLCKIITLIFHKEGAKIAIDDHVITIQQHSQYQFLTRLGNHSRENISQLYIVIVRIIEWYILPSNELIANKNYENNNLKIEANENNMIFYKIIRKFVEYLCIALEALQKTYISEKPSIFGKEISYGNVTFTLQYYINLLKDALAGTYTNDKLPESISSHQKISKNFIDFDKIKTLWDNKKIIRLCELFDNCFKTSRDAGEASEVKEKLIDGYLLTISNILSLTDTEFRNLIRHSNAD